MRQAPSIIVVILSVLVLAGPVGAQGRKPKKEEPASTLKEAKDAANRTLNAVDKGIHEAIPAVEQGANQALQAVDDAVHGHKKVKQK